MMRARGKTPNWNTGTSRRAQLGRPQGGAGRGGFQANMKSDGHGEGRTRGAARLQGRRYGGDDHYGGSGAGPVPAGNGQEDSGRQHGPGHAENPLFERFSGNNLENSSRQNPPYQGDDARRGGPTARHPPLRRLFNSLDNQNPGSSPRNGQEGSPNSWAAQVHQSPYHEHMSPRDTLRVDVGGDHRPEGPSERHENNQRRQTARENKRGKNFKKNRKHAARGAALQHHTPRVENEVNEVSGLMSSLAVDQERQRDLLNAVSNIGMDSAAPVPPYQRISQSDRKDNIQASEAMKKRIQKAEVWALTQSLSGLEENPTTSSGGAVVVIKLGKFVAMKEGFERIKQIFESFCEDTLLTELLETRDHRANFEELKMLLEEAEKSMVDEDLQKL